jgi:hypothetical protein
VGLIACVIGVQGEEGGNRDVGMRGETARRGETDESKQKQLE